MHMVLSVGMTQNADITVPCCVPTRVCQNAAVQHPNDIQFPVAVVRKAYVRARYTRHLVGTPDGGTISLDWWSGSHRRHTMHDASPVVLCLHAFAGGTVFLITSQTPCLASLNVFGCSAIGAVIDMTCCAVFVQAWSTTCSHKPVEQCGSQKDWKLSWLRFVCRRQQ